jgi:hypothetical protein
MKDSMAFKNNNFDDVQEIAHFDNSDGESDDEEDDRDKKLVKNALQTKNKGKK